MPQNLNQECIIIVAKEKHFTPVILCGDRGGYEGQFCVAFQNRV